MTGRRMDRPIERKTYKQEGKPTDWKTDRRLNGRGRKLDKQTSEQMDRQTNREKQENLMSGKFLSESIKNRCRKWLVGQAD